MRRLWTCSDWHKYIDFETRTGIRMRFEKGIRPEIREICMEFVKWLRAEYEFPVRVNLYFKNRFSIMSFYGEEGDAWLACPFEKSEWEPYILIAAGDWEESMEACGNNKENVLYGYLSSIIHELTHYFQWIKDEFTEENELKNDRQAEYYSRMILQDFKSCHQGRF